MHVNTDLQLENKSMRVQTLGHGCLIEVKKSKSKQGHNSEKMLFELSPLIVWIALWIAYSQVQVNTFSNKREIIKCQSFHASDDDEKGLQQYLRFSPKTAELKINL